MAISIVIWLWASVGAAIAVDFYKAEVHSSRPSVRLAGSVFLGVIGPFFVPFIIFGHVLQWMSNKKES